MNNEVPIEPGVRQDDSKFTTEEQRKRKRNAEYQRRYRARVSTRHSTKQKDLEINDQPAQSIDPKVNQPSTSTAAYEVPFEPGVRQEDSELSVEDRRKKQQKQKNAEYQRQYRARRSARDTTKQNKDVGVGYQQRYQLRNIIDLTTLPSGNQPSTINELPFTSSTINPKQPLKDRQNSLPGQSVLSIASNDDEQDVHSLPSLPIDVMSEGDRGEREVNIAIENNQEEPLLPYSRFNSHKRAHEYFYTQFVNNSFGLSCSICYRLWFKSDLTRLPAQINQNLRDILLPGITTNDIKVCSACACSLRVNKIPTFAVYNGFQYPPLPDNLPPLDIITERLISPRIPFMEIRRLRHINGQFGIFGQIINVPVNVNTMVNRLPRDLSEDYSVNVHIKKRKIHKSSYIQGLVNKRTVREWLTFLSTTPLYNDITIDPEFLAAPVTDGEMPNDDVSEEILIDDSLVAQQQTLIWDEDRYLRFAPGENNVPMSLLLDNYAEELSFPGIYLGHMRTFRDSIVVTPYQMASSEIRRTDRRGVTPRHLLYAAAKNMRLRVSSALSIAFKHIGAGSRISKEQIESEDYVNQCLDTNLAFLKNIPNSAYYWAQKKRDLFSMIRQLGRPTIFLTMSANEIGWTPLLQLLQRIKDGHLLSEDEAKNLSWLQKCSLVNEDSVTCAIYFDKLIITIMALLQSKKICPFGQYRVEHFFQRIEFQHRGSPHAHILLWLQNSPQHPLGENKQDAITLIDSLISVSTSQASGNIKLQTHKHTFTCYKRIRANHPQKCRFEAPFLPSRCTQIIVPMQKDELGFNMYSKRYKQIKSQYEIEDYNNIDDFYHKNNILSDEDYHQILRAGITRPRVFLKRQPTEKWHNPFNPFIFHHLRSNMDIQFILDEYSCAAYVVDYVNKANRGVSDLQRKIIEVTENYPDFGVVEITKKMSIDFLNSVEMSSQEAALWLLRKPMSKGSEMIVFIPTSWPTDRQRFKKASRELNLLDDDSTNIWKENIMEKYEQRPQTLDDLTLAQFGAQYVRCGNGEYKRLKKSRIIRYINYNLTTHLNDYKREMVLLHIPFRNEETDVLAESKFLNIYTENEHIILERRKQIESNIDIEKTLQLCQQLIREEEMQGDLDSEIIPGQVPEPVPFQQMYADPDSRINDDLRLATLSRLQAIAKRKENLMPHDRFCAMMRLTNTAQRSLLLEIIHHLTSQQLQPFRVFITGPAGCGKTFIIRLILELYNKYATTNAHCNAYLTCASTGKSAVAINSTTIHSALSLATGVDNTLSEETLHQFRSLFQHIRLLIIDEISMVGAELLERVDRRLKVITGKFDVRFGGLDVILVGDLRQLPPVKATPIFKQSKHYVGSQAWRSFKLFELTEVMRQSNIIFSTILTKIGNGDQLSQEELTLLESRFFTEDEAADLCPHGIRLAYSNKTIDGYNRAVLARQDNQILSTAVDFIMGCQDDEQRESARRALDKKTVAADTGGLLKNLTFVIGQHYMITTNIDVIDGLANGAIGKLVHVEQNEGGDVTRVWLLFPVSDRKIGFKASNAARAFIIENNIHQNAVPISRRNATIYLNRPKTLSAKRNHFPLAPACGLTIHKSQGATFDEVVYYYERGQSQQLVYVALSRATSIEGLYIISVDKKRRFYHGRRTNEVSCLTLRLEMLRLRTDPYVTLEQQLFDFLNSRQALKILSFNCQSLNAHANDLTDRVIQQSNILMLSETFMDGREQPVPVPQFDFVVRFQRQEKRNSGVAIYHRQDDRCYVVTPHLHIQAPYANDGGVVVSSVARIGDLCAIECAMTHDRRFKFTLIAIYISPNTSIQDIKTFIAKALLPLTNEGSQLLAKMLGTPVDYSNQAVILAGDFNVNFSLPQAEPLLKFLEEHFSLRMVNGRHDPTTKGGTTIDAVFARNLENLQLKHFISYFSYHNPIVTIVDLTNS